MKLILVILIMFCSGYIGIYVKDKYKRQFEFYLLLKEYINFLDANISLFKENIIEININFKIMQKNKNANNRYINLNNQDTMVFDLKKLQNTVLNKDDYVIIKTYLEKLGEGDYLIEKEKITQLTKFIDKNIINSKDLIKSKGDLCFKLSLALGAVISILIW